jgi:hypothetical protein
MVGHYVFNASAIGLGGILTSPKRKVIPSLASVALAPSGGEGSALVTNYNEDGVAFDRAETRVWGSSPDGRIYATRADVVVNNLNVFEQLKVESMWASVTSIREVLENGDVLDRKFTFQAEFLGVRVNGTEIEVPVDTAVFDNNASYADFVKALGSDEMADYRALIGMNPENTKSLARSPKTKGEDDALNPRTICCTAVSPKGKSGFHLPVEGLGTAHLAEALIKPGRRRLTLLRLELPAHAMPNIGSDGAAMRNIMLTRSVGGDGSMTIGSVEGNGTQTIP